MEKQLKKDIEYNQKDYEKKNKKTQTHWSTKKVVLGVKKWINTGITAKNTLHTALSSSDLYLKNGQGKK